ncbi:Protein trichome birefringence-like 31, partial [Bienertia sinuspersici]
MLKMYTCRFQAAKLLRILRIKRLMYVGDSIQRGTFDSIVCTLQSVIPDGKKLQHKVPSKKIFFAEEYNATIEFYWAPFMVELNSDHSTNHSVIRRMVKLDRIADHSKNWEGVDILVFKSFVWWIFHSPEFVGYTCYRNGDANDMREYNVNIAYNMALQTWSKWLDNEFTLFQL